MTRYMYYATPKGGGDDLGTLVLQAGLAYKPATDLLSTFHQQAGDFAERAAETSLFFPESCSGWMICSPDGGSA